MDKFEAEGDGAAIRFAAYRPRLVASAVEVDAPFLSQLLVERDHPPSSRDCRPQAAVHAYAQSAGMTVKRMPAGFRTTVVV